MNFKSLFVVIPVYNRRRFTQECLISLSRQTCRDFKIIVIDDGSTDGTDQMIKDEFPEVILLHGDGNLWWTKATNLGIKYALNQDAEYILTLNNDTILSEDYFEKMIFHASKKKDALLGSLALDYKTQNPVYGGEIINWKKAKFDSLLTRLEPDKYQGLHKVTHFLGRGLLIPSVVFKKIGLFDENNFPHYLADYDFTHKAVRNGFDIYCNYDAKLFMFTEESGDYKNRKIKSIKNYLNHLLGMKGGGNIKTFVIYSIKNCPRKYLVNFLIIGLFKRIFGYLYYWALEFAQRKGYSKREKSGYKIISLF